jgi:hypothetical protein
MSRTDCSPQCRSIAIDGRPTFRSRSGCGSSISSRIFRPPSIGGYRAPKSGFLVSTLVFRSGTARVRRATT